MSSLLDPDCFTGPNFGGVPELTCQPRMPLRQLTLLEGQYETNVFMRGDQSVSMVNVPLSVSGGAAGYLRKTPELRGMFPRIVDTLDSLLRPLRMDFEMRATLATDIEEPDWSALELRVNVRNKDYSEILRLWDQAAKSVYSILDKELAKKLYIMFSRVK